MSTDTVGPMTLMFERGVVGAIAIVSGIILLVLSAMGPMGTGHLEYRLSESAEFQLIGSDIVNAFLIAPILFIGGALCRFALSPTGSLAGT